MKILICTGIFPPEIGGPATYSRIVAEALSEQGHDVKVITYSDEAVKSGDDSYRFKLIRITRSWFKPWHYFKYLMAASSYGRDADVVYAQDPVSSGYPAMLAARRVGKPFVLKITGDYSWEQAMGRGLTDELIDTFQKQEGLPRSIRKIRDIQIKVSRSADRVIVPSQYLKRLVEGWGVEGKKIEVVYNAVPEMPDLNRNQAREELGIAQDGFLVVSAGRDVPWKGFRALAEVVAELKNDHLDIDLEIIQNRSHKETMKYIKSADVFVLNSGYEGFSHMLLEAMALGTPVIATRVGGNMELVRDAENGLLVEFNDKQGMQQAILKLYNDRGLGQKLAGQGRKDIAQMADKLSPEAMISKTLEILRQCAS